MKAILFAVPCFLLTACDFFKSAYDDGEGEDDRPRLQETEDTRLIRLRGAIRNDPQWQAVVYDVKDRSLREGEAVKRVDRRLVCMYDDTPLVTLILEGEFPEKGKEARQRIRKAYYCEREHLYWIHDRYTDSSYNRYYGPFILRKPSE